MTSTKPGNPETAAAEFLRALRGKRSQRAFAMRLGYRANPITDWEHGRRSPTAQEALRAASRVGIDVGQAFAKFHQAPLEREELAAWMDAIRGSFPITKIAERCGSSRFAVRRWLRGEAKPRLHEFFAYVDAITGRLPDFVAAFVPIDEVPSLVKRHNAAGALRSTAYAAPWSEAVLRVLETGAYRALPRHSDPFVAAQLGVPVEPIRASLALLVKAGMLHKRRGLYVVHDDETVETRGDRERVTQLLQHWSAVARDRAEQRTPEDLFAYNVFAISDADLVKAREILRLAYRELRALVSASGPLERVALVNVQLVAFSADRK